MKIDLSGCKGFCLLVAMMSAHPAIAQKPQGTPLGGVQATSAFENDAAKTIFGYLTTKVGREVALPSYQENALVRWSLRSYQEAGKDNKKLYTVIYEQLLVAQKLLSSQDVQQKRRGLRVAHNANFKAAARLKDKPLCAQIFDAFIMPNIAAAPTGRGTLSQARLLQDGASAYRLTGQREKQAGALQSLIAVAQKDKDTDGADWARVKLADVWAVQERYQEAADLLKAVTSPNMSGSKRVIAALEAKAAKKKLQTSTPVSKEKP